MSVRAIVILLLLASCAAPSADTPQPVDIMAFDFPPGTGILHGRGHVFKLTAPSGWVIDNQAGVPQGLHAVFYRAGESWQDFSAGMYANGSAPEKKKPVDLGAFMHADSTYFVEAEPGVKILTAAPIQTSDGREAIVRHFLEGPYGTFEAVAYIEEETAIATIVLVTHSRDVFEQALPSFAQLVQSYQFLGTELQTIRPLPSGGLRPGS